MSSEAILTLPNKAKSVSFLKGDGPEICFYAVFIGLLILLAFLARHRGARWFYSVERTLGRLSRYPAASVISAGLASLFIVMTLTAVAGVPLPKVDDEFSYLLAADTFAHGRLTNPPHPMWMHFETFHTIQQPTYASRYPPGQGLILALGQLLGNPVIGVWISTALACAAICWMLMAWLPPFWAVIGTFLTMVHPEILFWSQRYWGGGFTLTWGALALGGFRRLLGPRNGVRQSGEAPRLRDGWLLGIGVAILIVCRPYEGGVLTLILLAGLIARGATRKTELTFARLVRVGWPVVGCLAITMIWMGYYNWRVTQDPFRMPQQVYIATYNAAPVFIWQKPPSPPTYRHKQMRDFHMGWEFKPYLKQRSIGGLISGGVEKLFKLLRSDFRLWPLLLAIPALPWTLRNRWMQVAFAIWLVFTAALLQVTWTFFHYAAPAFGLFFVVAVQSLRHLRTWRWRGKPVGLFLVRGCLVVSALSLPFTSWRVAQQNRYVRRQQVIARLQQEGGKHLVIVHYATDAPNAVEWVHNKADINKAPIVWAREMDSAQNRELLNYFNNRRVWLLEVNKDETRLVPWQEFQTSSNRG